MRERERTKRERERERKREGERERKRERERERKSRIFQCAPGLVSASSAPAPIWDLVWAFVDDHGKNSCPSFSDCIASSNPQARDFPWRCWYLPWLGTTDEASMGLELNRSHGLTRESARIGMACTCKHFKRMLRGPAAILFVLLDTCSDRIASLLRLFLKGITQLSCDMLQNGVSHRCACVRLSTKPGYRTILGKC